MIDIDQGRTRLIIQECEKAGLSVNQAAYVLATAWHETNETMMPVREAYWLSETWRQANLRYYPWYGRGFVQLTWEYNYKKASEKTGVDLIANPDDAMLPNVAAEIIVAGMVDGWFTGKKLSDYIDGARCDFEGARRIVNGTDMAHVIAVYAEEYAVLLYADDYGRSSGGWLLEAILRLIAGWKK